MSNEAIAIELTRIFVKHASSRLCLTDKEIFEIYYNYLELLNDGEEDE